MSATEPVATTARPWKALALEALTLEALTLRWVPAVFVSLTLSRAAGPGSLATTILWAPMALAALAEIRSAIVAAGGRRPSRAAQRLHHWGVAALIAATVAQVRFPIAASGRFLMGLFAAIVLHRAVTLTLAARPLLGARLTRKPSWIFALLPLVVYLAFLPWKLSERQPNGDEPLYLLLTHSLAYDFDTRLSNNYEAEDWRHFTDRAVAPQEDDPVGPDGEFYSRHNFILPLVLAPAYRLAGRPAALAVMALLAALLAWSTLRLGRHYFPEQPGAVLLSYTLLAFSPPALIYASQIWVEIPAALLTVLTLDVVLSLRAGSGRRPWLWLLAGALGLFLLKLRFGLVMAPLLALAAWRSKRSLKQVVLISLILAGLGSALLAYNLLIYDNVLKIHRWAEILELHENPPEAFVKGLTGLFFDCAFGLFACAPIWALLLLVQPGERIDRRRWRYHFLCLFGLYVLVLAPRTEWFGGFSPPFRYGMPLLPMLALGLVPVFAERHRGGIRLLLSLLLILTAVLTLCWIVVPGWGYNLAHGRTHLLDLLSLRWGHDVARFFPSLVRPRLATWIWPPLLFLMINLAGRWPRRQWRGGGASAGAAGAVLVFGLAVGLPLLAAKTPTRIVELEDPNVKTGNAGLYPALWTPHRIRYRAGRLLQPDSWLKVRVRPAQDVSRLTVELNFLAARPELYELVAWRDKQELGRFRGRQSKDWDVAVFELDGWPPGGELWLTLEGPTTERRRVLIVDRAVFSKR